MKLILKHCIWWHGEIKNIARIIKLKNRTLVIEDQSIIYY